jgi:enoyl-CoA hydratase/carnithine racemase
MGDAVRFDLVGASARVTIDREERRNALSADVIEGLLAALRRASAEDAAQVVVLTGAGERAFCAGGDIGGFATDTAESAPAAIARLLDAVWHHPKPTIARVNGGALGGGFGLMMACDLAIAADDVEVGMPEVNLGLWPHVITAVVQRTVPRRLAVEMMMTGRRLQAEEALRHGLVNRVVPRGDLDPAVEELAAALAGKSPAILRLGKRSFTGAEDLTFGAAIQHLKDMLAENLQAEDLAEGVAAFLEKRAPRWKGR